MNSSGSKVNRFVAGDACGGRRLWEDSENGLSAMDDPGVDSIWGSFSTARSIVGPWGYGG